MKHRYEIRIVEYVVEESLLPKKWHQGAGNNPGDEDGNWGYSPETITKKEVERLVLLQNVEDIDLYRVIMAINHHEET